MDEHKSSVNCITTAEKQPTAEIKTDNLKRPVAVVEPNVQEKHQALHKCTPCKTEGVPEPSIDTCHENSKALVLRKPNSRLSNRFAMKLKEGVLKILYFIAQVKQSIANCLMKICII